MTEVARIRLNSSAIHVEEEKIYLTSVVPKTGNTRVLLLDLASKNTHKLFSLKGSRSYLIRVVNNKLFIGVDHKLLLCDSKENWRTVLASKNTSNFFWHMAISSTGILYAQEYGEPPTGIYRSLDGEEWELLVSSRDLDNRSRHFHSLVYDNFRDKLIATLGDGNHTRIVASSDGGMNWEPVYKGAWQVLPIAVQRDKVIFGMDSGITRGGLITWYPSNNKFEISHLRWKNSAIHTQMADLSCLDNDYWVAALGTPQALVTSVNLRDWYPVYIEGFNCSFDPSMSIGEGKNIVSFTTGKNVVSVEKRFLPQIVEVVQPTICEYKAFRERVVGIGWAIKKRMRT